MPDQKLQFKIETNIVNSYKRLPYTAWYAIAEFIDNSTQSFFNNRKLLEQNSKGSRPLEIHIEYDATKQFFQIIDNAMGMSFSELSDALCVSKPPSITSGRSQFGMGMKTAAAWIGNYWNITTKKFGESTEYSVNIEVEKIAEGIIDLPFTEKEANRESHYTIITILNHNQKFYGRTIGKIESYLKSMYRQDFRNNILSLFWRGNELNWDEIFPRLAVDKFGNRYMQEFSFNVGIDSENKDDVKNKLVKGWIGVLAKGSRQDAGFTIFHANRVIRGWPNTYRPESIFGIERNDLLNQRLIGEIFLDDFLVSHTKDAIQWFGDQEEQIEEYLITNFAGIINYANEVRTGQEDSRGPSIHEVEVAANRLEEELNSNEFSDLFLLEQVFTDEMVKMEVEDVISRVKKSSEPDLRILIGGITVYLFIQVDLSINDRYLTIESTKPDEVIVIVNKNHPHWSQLVGTEGVLNYLRHCIYDGIAEWKARNKIGNVRPDTIKIFKDGYLRLQMEIEKSSLSDD